ncbi:MAG: single-stranded DNA-binding protein [Leptonema sp. (in: Bacteria)]|nr:single-stranded DNA-binding protein [Leptonema sp. (in: bacteria)]
MLIGRLTGDPELKSVAGGSQLCSFSLANNRSYSRQGGDAVEEVSYFNCTLWGKPGEIFHKYASKGKQVAIEGRLRQRRWQTPEGKNQSAVDIIVENFQFLGGRGDTDSSNYSDSRRNQGTESNQKHEPPQQQETEHQSESFSDYSDSDDDIPF